MPVWLVFYAGILALFYAFNMVMVCSLFYWLMLCSYDSVILGLFIMFWVISLHGFLVCCDLFVLYVSLAIAAVNVRLRYFFSTVLCISYICKVCMFIDFCSCVGCPIFALTNYNTMSNTAIINAQSQLKANNIIVGTYYPNRQASEQIKFNSLAELLEFSQYGLGLGDDLHIPHINAII